MRVEKLPIQVTDVPFVTITLTKAEAQLLVSLVGNVRDSSGRPEVLDRDLAASLDARGISPLQVRPFGDALHAALHRCGVE